MGWVIAIRAILAKATERAVDQTWIEPTQGCIVSVESLHDAWSKTLNQHVGPRRQLVQDTLRGPALAAVPFFNPRALVQLLDSAPAIQDEETRDRLYGMFLTILSVCVLQSRYQLAS